MPSPPLLLHRCLLDHVQYEEDREEDPEACAEQHEQLDSRRVGITDRAVVAEMLGVQEEVLEVAPAWRGGGGRD